MGRNEVTLRRISLLFAALSLGAARMAVSGVLPVASDGSTPFPTLRDAIAAAQAGDTITVAPGVYDETADPIVAEIAVESITLIGLGDLPSDASITGAHIWFHASGIHHVENLRFFGDVRLASGYPPSSMTMRNCVVDDRVDSDHGDTITIGSEALVQDCVFQNLETFSSLSNDGFALNVTSASQGALVERCTFSNVVAHGDWAALSVASRCVVRECVFWNNSGGWAGAVHTSHTCCGYPDGPVVENCTFWRNESRYGGAAVFFEADYAIVTHSVFAETINGWGSILLGGGFTTCCDYWMNERGTYVCAACQHGGNFQADPLFCDAAGGDFRIDPDSPCQPRSHDGVPCGLVGAFGDCAPTSVEGTVSEPGTGSPLVVLRNPTGSSASLLLATSTPGTVSGSVHATDGRRVLDIVPRAVGAGEARVEVTMPDELSGGTYYVRLETPDGVRTARLVLLR